MAGPAARADRYDFCFSFAAEQRPYVEEVARLLSEAGLRVFYDSYETANLLGVDLYAHLDEIYNRRSRFCVLFASAAYGRKAWPSHERASAQDRALRSADAYVLPVRFDDTEVPGLRDTVGYVDARVTSPAGLVRILLEKLESDANVAAVPASILALRTDARFQLGEVLREALSSCRVAIAPELISEGIRQAFAAIPESKLSAVEVATTLVAELERFARMRPDLKLRIVVHRGEVPSSQLTECVDVVEAVEAAASAAVAEVFDLAPQADCAVVVTERVYNTVIRPGRGGSNPKLFSLITTVDGRGLYVRVPGYPRLPRSQSSGASEPAPVAGSTGQINTFMAPVTAEQIGNRYYGGDHEQR